MNTPAPQPGLRFFHARIYNPALMPQQVPQMFEVSCVRAGAIYYRPVYRYEPTGRIEVGKAKDYCSSEYWPKVCLRVATQDESSQAKMLL